MQVDRKIFVVDDDVELRRSVCALVSSMGYEAASFASAEEFLASGVWQARGVVVADLRMPGMTGIELQEELSRRGAHLPLIILTAYARTSTTVKAIKAGAVTMIDKPYSEDDLWNAIREGLAVEATAWAEREQRRSAQERLASLAPEERAVMDLLLKGVPNKAIARQLGLGVRTVEKRRHNILSKMGVSSLPQLAAIVIESRRGA